MLTVLTNARILDCTGDDPLEDSSIIIEDEVIGDIYTGRKRLPAGAIVIDVGGKTVLAGPTGLKSRRSSEI